MANVIGTISYHDQFKIRYANKIGKYLPSFAILQEKFPFTEKEQTGEKYVMPILTRRGHGFTYAASGAGSVTFGDLDTSKIVKASLNGSQIFGGDGLDWEAAVSALGFTDSMDLCMQGLWDSHRFRMELDTLWGQNAKGTIGKIDGLPATSATATVTLLASEVSAGILYNLEGAKVDIFSSNFATLRAGSPFEILTVDPDAGTFTLDNSGGIIQDTDVVFLEGQRTTGAQKHAAGLHVWATNTTSIAGIDAASNIVWKPNVIDLQSNAITFDDLLNAANALHSRGHIGKLVGIVSPKSWSRMMSDQSTLVRRTPQEKKYVLGADALTFTTGVGEIEVIAHPYEKEGYAHIFPVMTQNADGEYAKDEVDKAPIKRIGAQDLCFMGPDAKTTGKRDAYFEKLQRTNVLYVETYSNQALFVSCPSRCVTFIGVDPEAE
jgi:hypothetical protein